MRMGLLLLLMMCCLFVVCCQFLQSLLAAVVVLACLTRVFLSARSSAPVVWVYWLIGLVELVHIACAGVRLLRFIGDNMQGEW
jgi:hypothetical protein